eukprot:675343-Lingulodinium_polyedra.AAC.1
MRKTRSPPAWATRYCKRPRSCPALPSIARRRAVAAALLDASARRAQPVGLNPGVQRVPTRP